MLMVSSRVINKGYMSLQAKVIEKLAIAFWIQTRKLFPLLDQLWLHTPFKFNFFPSQKLEYVNVTFELNHCLSNSICMIQKFSHKFSYCTKRRDATMKKRLIFLLLFCTLTHTVEIFKNFFPLRFYLKSTLPKLWWIFKLKKSFMSKP